MGFVGDVAKVLFPSDVSAPGYLAQLRRELKHVASCAEKIGRYLMSDPDYVACAAPLRAPWR
eukprot:5869630-Prymnesium_polylepis.1